MGRIKTNVSKIIASKVEEKKANHAPFEADNILQPLKLFIIIVPYGQANGVIKILHDLEVAMSVTTQGEGTYLRESQFSGPKKQLIFAFIKEANVEEFKSRIADRFQISSAAKGIAFSVKLTSVAGVSVYKFLTNTQQISKKENKLAWKKQKKN